MARASLVTTYDLYTYYSYYNIATCAGRLVFGALVFCPTTSR